MLSGVEPMTDKFGSAWRKLKGGSGRHPMLKETERHFKNFNQDKKLTEYEFVVMDTELTGLSPRRDEIVSIGAIRIRDFMITADSFYTLVAPKAGISKTSTLIHRITDDQVKNSPRLREVLPKFVKFCGNALIVGHNIGLDMQFMNRAAPDILGGKIKTPCLDTMRLAQIYEAEQWENYYDRYDSSVSFQLGNLSRKYGLPAFDQHNSLYDAMQTAYLFIFLVKKLHSGGVKTLKDLYMAGRSWRFYM